MTPFMSAVAAVVDAQAEAVAPATAEALPKPVGEGADYQVAVRSLAEQLVSEANAVLAARGERIDLVDEAVDGRLCFTLSYRDRRAELSMAFDGRHAQGRLLCDGGVPLPGEFTDTRHELADPKAVADLILALLSGQPSFSQQIPVEA
jgi:hypothetical protein